MRLENNGEVLCREVWLGFSCSFASSYLFLFIFLFLVFSIYMVSLLFKAIRPYQNPKMDSFIFTELKNPNPGCYLSMWRSLKPRENSEKLLKSSSTEYFLKAHQRAAVSSASGSTFFLFAWVLIAGRTGTLISDLKGKWFLQGSVLRIPDSPQELEDSCTLQKRCWTSLWGLQRSRGSSHWLWLKFLHQGCWGKPTNAIMWWGASIKCLSESGNSPVSCVSRIAEWWWILGCHPHSTRLNPQRHLM